MAPTEEAMRRAGALAAVAAAAALFPAPVAVGHWYVVLVLALFVAFLLGCAAVVLSPAHHAVAQAARRAAEAAREILAMPWRAATGLRWVGFTGMVFYAVCLVSRPPPSPPAKEEMSVDKVNAIFLLLVFLAGVLAVNLSMLTGRGSEPAPPPTPAAAAAEEQLDGGEVVRVHDSKEFQVIRL